MMRLVADASVAVKWLLPERAEEHVDPALAVLAGVRARALELVEPPHWFAEVAAVVVRLRPSIASQAVGLIAALDFDVAGDRETYEIACDLATRLRHHLFDTLYHAVALQHGAELVTADLTYYRKARSVGSIRRLSEIPAMLA